MTVKQKLLILSDQREYGEVLEEHLDPYVTPEQVSDLIEDAEAFATAQGVRFDDVTVCDTCGVFIVANDYDDECVKCSAARDARERKAA